MPFSLTIGIIIEEVAHADKKTYASWGSALGGRNKTIGDQYNGSSRRIGRFPKDPV